MRDLDDPLLRAAMAAYVRLADQLDATAALGSEARNLLDQAEAKAMAGLALRRRLVALGWTPPDGQRSLDRTPVAVTHAAVRDSAQQ